MRYNARSSGFDGYGIMIFGLHVRNRDTMAVKRQGTLNREFLGLCYERSRKRCARNM